MEKCIFCNIVQNLIPSKKVFESETILVIQDIAPKAPIHYLIIPKKHYINVSDLPLPNSSLPVDLFVTAQQLSTIDRNHTQYRLLINNGSQVGQSVFHLHMHFLSGKFMNDF